MILVDTNVLVYAVNLDAEQHAACRNLIDNVQAGRLHCILVPQVLLEFYGIVTDARRVARPLSPQAACEIVQTFQQVFTVRDVCQEALERLDETISEKKPLGGDIFDAWLVAQMRALGVDRVCTYNASDFVGYRGIRAVRPDDLI